MDIHPIAVHFPIALLALYSVFEIFSIKRLVEKSHWFYIKAIFVSLGTLGAWVAAVSGYFASHYVEGVPLIDVHARFAIGTVLFFALISIPYLLAWFGNPSEVKWASRIIFKRTLMIPLGLVGLVLIIITGGLGGAIVYGTQFDPTMAPIFKFLNVY